MDLHQVHTFQESECELGVGVCGENILFLSFIPLKPYVCITKNINQ